MARPAGSAVTSWTVGRGKPEMVGRIDASSPTASVFGSGYVTDPTSYTSKVNGRETSMPTPFDAVIVTGYAPPSAVGEPASRTSLPTWTRSTPAGRPLAVTVGSGKPLTVAIDRAESVPWAVPCSVI